MSARLADTVFNQARARFANSAQLLGVFRKDNVTFRKKLSVFRSKPCSRTFSAVWIRCMQQRNNADAHLERNVASCRSAAKLEPCMSVILKITQRGNSSSTRLCSAGLSHMCL